jgi:hypothetical protein
LNEVVAAFQKLQSKITSYPAVRLSLLPSRSCSYTSGRHTSLARNPFPSIDRHLPSVDADVQTAQVAAQQGKYLAKMYGTLAKRIDTLDANEMPDHDDEMYYKPFKYLHLGTLAYIGNSCV